MLHFARILPCTITMINVSLCSGTNAKLSIGKIQRLYKNLKLCLCCWKLVWHSCKIKKETDLSLPKMLIYIKIWLSLTYDLYNGEIYQKIYFWPRGFADAVLGTAYLLLLLLIFLFLFLENFFEFHEKSGHSLHC